MGSRKGLKNGEHKPNCSKCGMPKEPHRIRYDKCLGCHGALVRISRSFGPTPERRKKDNLSARTRMFLKKNRLQKPPCFVCKNPKSEAVHLDPDVWEKVVFLCRAHRYQNQKEPLELFGATVNLLNEKAKKRKEEKEKKKQDKKKKFG